MRVLSGTFGTSGPCYTPDLSRGAVRPGKVMGKFICLIGLLAAATSHASVMVSLTSPTNLSTLSVGQTFTVAVNISGLPSNNVTNFIYNLETQVLFPSALLTAIPDPNNSSGLTPGFELNSNSLKSANFNTQSSLNTGSAVGNFSSSSPNLSAGPLFLNGVYYSFMLQAAAVGSGTISFNLVSDANRYAADETSFNFAPLVNSGPLSFQIK
jgi:hypothetical protein